MKHQRVLAILTLITITILATPALAQELNPPPEISTDLAAFLSWLLTASGALFLGAGISFLAEKIPAFQRIPKSYKFPTIIAATMASSLIAQVLTVITPPHMITAIQPYWRTAVMALLALVSSQVTHQKVNHP